MATNTGKVIGARLPLADYIIVLAKAADLKMNISDYLLFKLFASEDPSASGLQQTQLRINQQTDQLATLEQANATLTSLTSTFKQQLDTREQNHLKTVQLVDQTKLKLEAAHKTASQQQAEISKLTKQLATERNHRVTAQQKLQDLRQALADEHNESSSREKMDEKYWAIVDRFVPRKE